MDEGTLRVLRALGRGGLSETDWIASAGEAASVVRELRRQRPEWFVTSDTRVELSDRGVRALARELVERSEPFEPEDPGLADRFREIAEQRAPIKRELDQVWATTDTVLRRARLLIERGDLNRGLALLGDDDLTSIALGLAGLERPLTVFELDPALVDLLGRVGPKLGDLRVISHDLRDPVPKKLLGRFGAVFTDPPYAETGFRLFVSRAIDLTRPDGRIWIASGVSRRASERGLQKQAILAEAGLFIEEILPDFNRYEGALSIGAVSSLYLCRRTPKTRSLVSGREDGDLYTRRSSD